jgi:hypothetical protein
MRSNPKDAKTAAMAPKTTKTPSRRRSVTSIIESPRTDDKRIAPDRSIAVGHWRRLIAGAGENRRTNSWCFNATSAIGAQPAAPYTLAGGQTRMPTRRVLLLLSKPKSSHLIRPQVDLCQLTKKMISNTASTSGSAVIVGRRDFYANARTTIEPGE